MLNQNLDFYQEQLNKYSDLLHFSPEPIDQLIKKYVSIYIEARIKSQQFFPIFCEHAILQRILSRTSGVKIQEQTCLLECVNLLLSNTKTSNQLVYYLSQKSLHQYLFHANTLKQSPEFIEYYVQLIKTLLLKICENQQNKAFIKLFCNDKYPNFDILQYSFILATYEENQLVRVTAQQCVLIIIVLINQYKIYQPYLCEFGFVTMIFKLIIRAESVSTEANSQKNENNTYCGHDQMEEVCKYLVDLMFELRENRTTLLLINNIICNVVVVRNIPYNWNKALRFILSLSSSLCLQIQENVKEIEQPIIDNLLIICATHLRVLTKLLTNSFISGSYLGNFIAVNTDPLCDISLQMFPSLINQYRSIIEMFSGCNFSYIPYLQNEEQNFGNIKKKIKFKDISMSENQLQSLNMTAKIKEMAHHYENSRQFLKIKSSYDKKFHAGQIGNKGIKQDNGFFDFLFKKTDWVKKVCSLAGLEFTKGKLIAKMFPKCINPQTSLFITEYAQLTDQIDSGVRLSKMKFGQTLLPQEVHSNSLRNYWNFTTESLSLLNILCDEYQVWNKDSLEGLTFQSSLFVQEHTVISKLSAPYYSLMILQFREYLSTSLFEKVIPKPNNKSLILDISSIVLLHQLCEKIDLQINKNSSKNLCYVRLVEEMGVLHQYAQTCVFQGQISKLAIPFWNTRSRLFQKPENKESGIIIDCESAQLKTRGKKRMSHREKFRNKLQKSISSIKRNKQQVINSSTGHKKVQEPAESMQIFFCRKMLLFELLQKIIAPNLKPLNDFFDDQWSFHSIPPEKQDEQEFTSVLQSDSSLITVHQVIKQFTVSYYGKNQCLLSFIKNYTPHKIIAMCVSLHAKKFLEIDITQIKQIRKNKIDPKVLQIIQTQSHNAETIKVYNEQEANRLIKKFDQCKHMIQAALADAIFGYLGQTHNFIEEQGKQMQEKPQKSKKNKVKIISVSQNSHEYTDYKQIKKLNISEFEETPRG